MDSVGFNNSIEDGPTLHHPQLLVFLWFLGTYKDVILRKRHKVLNNPFKGFYHWWVRKVKKTTFFRYVLDLYFAERALIGTAHSITCCKLLTKQIVSNLTMVPEQKKTVLILMDKLLNIPRERWLKIDWSFYSIRQPFLSTAQLLGRWSKYYSL